MLPDELEAAISVWRAANVARGAPHGTERTARIREKLSAPDALAFVALRPEIVGMALAEPGRLDDGAGELDPTLLHISMVFVHPAAQGTGVGRSLVLHALDAGCVAEAAAQLSRARAHVLVLTQRQLLRPWPAFLGWIGALIEQDKFTRISLEGDRPMKRQQREQAAIMFPFEFFRSVAEFEVDAIA